MERVKISMNRFLSSRFSPELLSKLCGEISGIHIVCLYHNEMCRIAAYAVAPLVRSRTQSAVDRGCTGSPRMRIYFNVAWNLFLFLGYRPAYDLHVVGFRSSLFMVPWGCPWIWSLYGDMLYISSVFSGWHGNCTINGPLPPVPSFHGLFLTRRPCLLSIP